MKLMFHWLIVILAVGFLAGCGRKVDVPTLLGQSKQLIIQEKWDAAKQLLSEALAANPKSIECRQLRSDCYYNLHKIDSMIQDLRFIAQSREASCEDRLRASNDIASEFDVQLENDSALKYQRMCLNLKQECNKKGIGFTYIIISTLLARKGEHAMALAALDSAVLFDEELFTVSEARARIFTSLGEIDSALRWQTIAIHSVDEFPGDVFEPGRLYGDRALLYFRNGEANSACLDWQKALALGLQEAQAKLDSFCSGIMKGAPDSH